MRAAHHTDVAPTEPVLHVFQAIVSVLSVVGSKADVRLACGHRKTVSRDGPATVRCPACENRSPYTAGYSHPLVR
jgi:hypothetical protein